VPGARRIATLVDDNITPAHHLDALRAAARSRGVELTFYPIKGRPRGATRVRTSIHRSVSSTSAPSRQTSARCKTKRNSHRAASQV
jgi:hypothetical protein